jgi:hypothetical protein
MITVITTFRLPKALSRTEAEVIFLSTAPSYLSVPGLVRKTYILSEDGGTAGGVYLWTDRRHAEAMYTDQWREFVEAKYGVSPVLTIFESPVLVDTASQQVITSG